MLFGSTKSPVNVQPMRGADILQIRTEISKVAPGDNLNGSSAWTILRYASVSYYQRTVVTKGENAFA